MRYSTPTQFGGEAALVLLDSDARKDTKDRISITVATAFSTADGDLLWGPTEVPGPSPGNGLIFANTPNALSLAGSGTKARYEGAHGPSTGCVIILE
ncbi:MULTISPECIES: hypothetical protein [unclassified Arthrobacter]|uniref:hypothetical protein n=1 Tax=unclassified Arthrobacter TaxID=235627 RepID=UPI002E020EE2|nr:MULTISPECIES: hypothetical protein [unclassified Arthrobacter]MEC5193357.1 hypothetical protein [Arthrobacter sp. MP_M4]MEC5204823.1 hypothetical protein [Arthrobacter sp. MP_M7]